MPCRDYMAEDEYRQREYQELQAARKTIDQMTRMLCSLCKQSEDNVEFPHNVRKWWEDHKAADELREIKAKKQADAARKRKAREKAKKELAAAGLAKLSDKERKALGL